MITRRRILTLLGFSTLLKAAEETGVRPVTGGQPAPLPVDPVKTASELLKETQGVLQELTDVLLAELNGIEAFKAAGLHFQRKQDGAASVWRQSPAGGFFAGNGLYTLIDVCKRRRPTSFAHLDLNQEDGSVKLLLYCDWLPAEVIVHPLWETDRFCPSMHLRRKPTIQP